MKRNRQLLVAPFLILAGPCAVAEPLSILDAYDSALVNNPELSSEEYYARAESAGVDEAWAAVKPQLDFSVGYGVTNYTQEYSFRSSEKGKDEHQRVDLTLSQILYSQQAFEGISRAARSEEKALTALQSKVSNVSLQLIAAYLDVVKYQRIIDVVRNELDSHQRRLTQVNEMLARGFSTRAQMLEAQARVDEISARLVRSENDHRVALQQLSQLTGAPVESVQPVAERLWQATPDLLARPWAEMAVDSAPDVQVAEAELELAESNRRYETAGHYPELFIKGRYTDNDTFATSLVEEARIEVQLSVPIYKGGSTSARSRAAGYRVQGAEYALQNERKAIVTDVDRTMSELNASYSNVRALTVALNSNKASEQAADEGFRAGVRNLTELLDIRKRRSAIEQQLIEAIYLNLSRQYKLRYLAGQLDREDLQLLMGAPGG